MKSTYFGRTFYLGLVLMDDCGFLFFEFHRRWILTAAHCLLSNETLEISLGIDSNGRFEKTVRVNVAEKYIYPMFHMENHVGVYDLGEVGEIRAKYEKIYR